MPGNSNTRTMKYFFSLYFIIVLAEAILCKPLQSDKEASILTSEFKQDDPYSRSFSYETSNGIRQAETMDFEETGKETGLLVRKGYYTYRGADDSVYVVTYVADDKGFRPRTHKLGKNTKLEDLEAGNKALFDEINDDRIGTTLLISLGGGGVSVKAKSKDRKGRDMKPGNKRK